MKIIMDKHKQIKSITEVQEAEAQAAKRVEDALKEKDRMIANARDKASSIISNAIEESKQNRDKEIKSFLAELEKRKKKDMETGVKASKSLKSRKLGEAKRKELAGRLARIILGE
jgi:vacuolar-type H+-ATPase subunit H